jgi:hypothetical protein
VLGIPTLPEIRTWVAVPASAISDADLTQILDAELAIQARTCRLPEDPDPVSGEEATYPAALSRSVLRRCQREIAAKSLPLGIVGGEAQEYGPMLLRSWDAEISRLEASYRQVVIA